MSTIFVSRNNNLLLSCHVGHPKHIQFMHKAHIGVTADLYRKSSDRPYYITNSSRPIDL